MRSIWRTVPRGDIRDALVLAAAIAVVGASFGALAGAAGFGVWTAMTMSLLVFAGGSQFLALAVVAAGGGALAAVLGGLLLNARHLPFGLAIGDTVGPSWPARLIGAHLMIDESVAFTRARPEPERARSAYWLVGVLMFVAWNIGTLVGVLAGAALPDPAAFGTDAAFPAGLLALLLPALRAPDALRVGIAGAAVALGTTAWLPPGLPVLCALLGLALFSRPVERGPV